MYVQPHLHGAFLIVAKRNLGSEVGLICGTRRDSGLANPVTVALVMHDFGRTFIAPTPEVPRHLNLVYWICDVERKDRGNYK